MHESEWDELHDCVDCGAELLSEPDRGYAFGEEGTLCFSCAVRRGGQWDPSHDRWVRAPDLRGLGDARRSSL